MRIYEIKPVSDADYAAYVNILNNSWSTVQTTIANQRVDDQQRQPHYVLRRFMAEHEDVAVGCGRFCHVDFMHHPQRFYWEVDVLPGYRRRGFGNAMYEHLMNELAAYNPIELLVAASSDCPDGIRFVEKRGYTEAIRYQGASLDTAHFDPIPFAGLLEGLQAEGIVIQSLAELAADPERDRKLYALEGQLQAEAPMIDAATQAEFAIWQKNRSAENPFFLPDAYFVALYDGEYIGLSAVVASQGDDRLETFFTGVQKAYRGRGIALALKLRVVEYAQALGNRTIITSTASTNDPMRGINRRLGFVLQPAELVYKKMLPTP